MTAQDVRENSTKVVKAQEYFDLSLVWDGWLLVDRHAWQILMINPSAWSDRYIVHVWHPVKNVIRRAVVTAYVNVWIMAGGE